MRDLNWTLPGLTAFLYALGGWSFKWIRRFGMPAAIVLYAILYYRFRKKRNIPIYIVLFVAIWGATTLPLTLIGNGIPAHWFNSIWIFIVGGIQIVALLPLVFLSKTLYPKIELSDKIGKWVVSLVLTSIFYGFFVLNSGYFNWFEHKWTELFLGLCIGASAAWIIGKE